MGLTSLTILLIFVKEPPRKTGSEEIEGGDQTKSTS